MFSDIFSIIIIIIIIIIINSCQWVTRPAGHGLSTMGCNMAKGMWKQMTVKGKRSEFYFIYVAHLTQHVTQYNYSLNCMTEKSFFSDTTSISATN
jgi:hypothetical protein